MLLRIAVFAKGLTDLVKPFSLEQGRNPIRNPIHHAGYGAVDDDRAGDFEQIGV